MLKQTFPVMCVYCHYQAILNVIVYVLHFLWVQVENIFYITVSANTTRLHLSCVSCVIVILCKFVYFVVVP